MADRRIIDRYLVTGGAGFIGSHVADTLVARGADVTILDDLSTGSRANVELCWRAARRVSSRAA